MKIDGSDHILGRLSTSVVEALKDGEDVEIYNADRIIVKGRPDDIIQKYRGKYERGSKGHGPKYPKAPDRMVRRTVRGMLPDSKQGRQMYERLQVYTSEPGDEATQFEDDKVRSLKGGNFLRMGEISENMG